MAQPVSEADQSLDFILLALREGHERIIRWAVTICKYTSGFDLGRDGGGTGV